MPKLLGEFRPPRELTIMGVARVTGPGSVTVGEQGLVVDGRVSAAPIVSRMAMVLSAGALILVGALVPGSERVVLPLLLLGAAGAGWLAWRAEYGARGAHEVPWTRVEHVARLPGDPEVVVIVLSGAIAGSGSPEQLYFAASNGVDAATDAIREHAPPSLSMDLTSALRETPSE